MERSTETLEALTRRVYDLLSYALTGAARNELQSRPRHTDWAVIML